MASHSHSPSPNPSPKSNAVPPPPSAPPPSPAPSAPPPSNSSASPPPASPPPSNSSAPPPSKSSAPPPSNSSATPPPAPSAPPPSNFSASPPPAPPPPSNPSSPAPPPSNSSAASPRPAPSAPPPSPPPVSRPAPPSKNSSTPSPAPPHRPPPSPHSPPPPPKRVPSSSPPPPAASENPFNSLELSTGSIVVIGTFVGLLALSLVVLAVCILCGRKKKKNEENVGKDISNTDHHYAYVAPFPFASTQNSAASSTIPRPQYSNASTNNFSTSSDVGMGSSRSWFTYKELSDATDGFSVNNLIGQGGFGCVYKGVLNTNGRQVAVKQLKADSGQGEREFRAEVEIISRIHHKHLVSLVGYCISENQRLLVYDFVSNNNLDYHLHDNGKPAMDWASRVKVASGAARGLAYLHEDCQPRIIHRDIKSTNILLDDNFEAKVADFGLAKMALELDLHTHVSTRVMGTFGYMAPEYAASGKLTEKSDVFSFGVVLLELITGRMPVDPSQPLGDESLVECARPLLAEALKTQDFDGLVDPRLENNFIEDEMFRMIEAAAACVRHSAAKRPKMSQIARALDSMDELADLNNGIRPGQSGNFDSREHSARIRMFDKMAFGSKDNSSEFTSRSQRSWMS